ncbi:hypothetical protein [Deinococcus cellulosilyticus]|uniref:Uncharacterized protein n=1 Tax=Deinococcus cellulosilyticus (strain DSM 18568 / NBRC 106333 / KACC 11606 / 5516J-15) TaxID=1223518 RepID=A0A511MWP3_DEIC1|nr:hypothetical protein [Deinococcus cellulosilyticus]GEM44801.1 hypothetical protein DC3_04360 [Deinococcus cellulosilyticus NBRC 106333 = KACC 11606]
MKQLKQDPTSMQRKVVAVMAVNIMLCKIQSASTHPGFFHERGLHGQVLVDHAGFFWWNDPRKGFVLLLQAPNYSVGPTSFRGLLRLVQVYLQHDQVIPRKNFPGAGDLGLDQMEWEGILSAAQAAGVVSA